jgi:hypothetical protein
MKLAVMQPYFFPYIGYFQLMAAVDRFVILDDVSYINRGWINRNRLPSDDGPVWLTLPVSGASQNRQIRDLEIAPDDGWKASMMRKVALTYAKAPYADTVLPQFERWVSQAQGNLSAFLCRCLSEVAEYAGIAAQIVPTSAIYSKGDLKGAERIMDICAQERASVYVNLPGGRELYDPRVFDEAGVKLLFLDTELRALPLEHRGPDGPTLSILDVMMQNPRDAIRSAVHGFRLGE